jgi:hypothetical protein
LSVAIAHITAAQMKALGAAMRRQFEIDALAMLRCMHPQTTGKHSDHTLQSFVRHGIERAKLSRLESVSEVQRWLRLMLRLGPHFDSDDAPRLAGIRAGLANFEVYGPLRLDEAEALASAIAPEPR